MLSDGIFSVRFIVTPVPITLEGVTVTPDMIKIDIEIDGWVWQGTDSFLALSTTIFAAAAVRDVNGGPSSRGTASATGDLVFDDSDPNNRGFVSWRRSVSIDGVETNDVIEQTDILSFGAGGGASDNENEVAGAWSFTIR